MSEQSSLSPGQIIRSYLDGLADFNQPFDEMKILSLLRDHGQVVIPESSIDGYKSEAIAAARERDELRARLANVGKDLDRALEMGKAIQRTADRYANSTAEFHTELTTLRAQLEEAREALVWFLDDERFQVAVGGNPIVVERMIANARAVLAKLQPSGETI